VKTVNLALQGGGAHGAFAWGVLDRLLEERRIAFEGITASSAGAMNAVVLAYGLAVGGPQGAREALADFWRGISESGRFSLLQPSSFDRFTHNHSLEHSPAFLAFDLVTRLFSPYQFNPMNHNPLRDVLERTVDFTRLREKDCVKLFLSATNVCTGKVKVFENEEVSADSVLASACLPYIFQAVEIDGESYWDGGYMGNPALFPLIYNCDSADIVIVHINLIERAAPPRAAAHGRGDTQPGERDQLQLLADARDAGNRFRDATDRGWPARHRSGQAHADPRDRCGSVHARPDGLQQVQYGLGIPDPSARRRPRQRGPLDRGHLRQSQQDVLGRHPRQVPLTVRVPAAFEAAAAPRIRAIQSNGPPRALAVGAGLAS
jgi:predicted acylesterase/phospholipase RssA